MIIFFVVLSIFFGCTKEYPVANLGETIIVTAELPEENLDLDFIWELTSVPDQSSLINGDLIPGDGDANVQFTPDVSGIYSIEVSIFQYNDEISTESFTYDVVGNEMNEAPTDEVDPVPEKTVEGQESSAVSELLAENDEPKWYEDESVEEALYEVKDVQLQEKKELEVELQVPSSSPSEPETKSFIEKPKINKARGSSIPYDENRFTIQVGSKKELADAKIFAAKLIDAGYDAYIQKAVFKQTKEVWYRIRVGSYDKRETAVAVAKSLSKTQQENAWVDFVRYEY